MKKVWLRLLGLGLALVMLLGFVPIGASAAAPPKIGVTMPGYDDIGEVLTSMGIAYDEFAYEDVWYTYENMKKYDAIFLNCGSNYSRIDDKDLAKYVNEGGLVYASDWASDPILYAFPGKLKFGEADEQTIKNADILYKPLQLQMGKSKMDVEFDLPGWHTITEISKDVEVFIRGDVATEFDWDEKTEKVIPAKTVNYPLAVSFQHGKGRVFYTSFHNEAQVNADMINFLEYLIFNINLNKNNENMAEEAAKKGFGYVGPVFGTLNAGKTSAAFTYKATAGKDFMLMLSSSDGDFSLALKDPAGKAYNTGAAGGMSASAILQTITVTNPVAGDWKFTVTSKNAVNGAMFAVGIAEKGPAPGPADKTALNNRIAAIGNTKKGSYTDASWSAFQTALAAARQVAADENATQAQVNSALSALNTAFSGLRANTSANTIFSTGYKASFLNWILFFIGFGFIWMWF